MTMLHPGWSLLQCLQIGLEVCEDLLKLDQCCLLHYNRQAGSSELMLISATQPAAVTQASGAAERQAADVSGAATVKMCMRVCVTALHRGVRHHDCCWSQP